MIDLDGLQYGDRLVIYRGGDRFTKGPQAAGLVGTATVTSVNAKRAYIDMHGVRYRLRLKDGVIQRVPNHEATQMYVHAKSGERPTTTAYFTDREYALVKRLLVEEAQRPESPRTHMASLSALQRMEFHDRLRQSGGRTG